MSPEPHDRAPDPAAQDDDAFDRLRRRVLWALPTGLFVLGSRQGESVNLMTCNWVMQVATRPKLVAAAIESDSVTRSLVEGGGSFSVSLLSRSDRAVVRRFVKPTQDVVTDGEGTLVSMQGQPVVEVEGGLPRLAGAVAWLVCAVRSVSDWGELAGGGTASHVLVVGEVLDVGASDRLGDAEDDDPILAMTDTRMNYGG